MVGVVSHLLCAVAFLVLFLLLLTSWRGRLRGGLLVGAVFVTLLWAIAAAGSASGYGGLWVLAYRVLEIGRNLAWFIFLLALLEPLASVQNKVAKAIGLLRPLMFGFGILLLIAELMQSRVGVSILMFGHLALALAGLALIEQLFRNTLPEQRWSTKFLYLGIGSLFAYDFFLYADALLFRQLDLDMWAARGLVNIVIVPLLAVSAARNPQWSLDVFVSRRVVIHYAAVFGAGIYLLVMAGVGYYIRLYGGTWGVAVQLAFFFSAGVLLLSMLFSGSARARAKVFLNKHFFAYKYDYREEWLKFIGTLSASEGKKTFGARAISALAEIVESPAGVLWAREEDGSFQAVDNWNIAVPVQSVESGNSSLIAYLQEHKWLIELDQWENEPEFYVGLRLPDWLKSMDRAWVVVPLLQEDSLTGFIVLASPRAEAQINWEDRDLLKTAGRQVASYLALVQANEQLIDSRQFDAFNRLSAFVVHDLKNVNAQLSLVVSNAVRHRDNPEFVDDALKTVENAVARMDKMLAQLRKGAQEEGENAAVDLDSLFVEVSAARSIDQPQVSTLELPDQIKVKANREQLATVLQHLIQNAQEATPAAGRVELSGRVENGEVAISVTDTGSGMEDAFMGERLFRPFQTTKGNAGMGIGVYESREKIRAMGGRIEVKSQLGAGSAFTVFLPVASAMPEEAQPARPDKGESTWQNQAESY